MPTILMASSLAVCCRLLANLLTVRSFFTIFTLLLKSSVCITLNNVYTNCTFATKVEVEN